MYLLLSVISFIAVVTGDISANKYLPPTVGKTGNLFPIPQGAHFGHAFPHSGVVRNNAPVQGVQVAGSFIPSPFVNPKLGHQHHEPVPHVPFNYAGVPLVKSAEAGARILHLDNNNDGLGHYSYSYETENRIRAQEAGVLLNAGTNSETTSVQGAAAWIAPDGVEYSFSYTADENGFHPVGAHLPTPPPIPDAILKSLERNAAEEAAGIVHGYNANGDYPTQHVHHVTTANQYHAPSLSSFSAKDGYRY